jgi:environmental stress-induced protein Ves
MSLPATIPLASLREERWANSDGIGVTIAAGPDPGDWHWRLSLDRLERDGWFIPRPDTRRLLVPLDAALRVEDNGGRWRDIYRHQNVTFDGRPEFAFHLPEGPTRICMLMLRDGFDGDLHLRPLVGSMLLPSFGSAHWVGHMLNGSARLQRGAAECLLEPGDSFNLPAGNTHERTMLEGNGNVLLARVTEEKTSFTLQLL